MVAKVLKRIGNQKGFTLVEALIAIGLLSLALLTLMSMFTVSGRMIITSRQRTEATYLAQVLMERLTNETLATVAQFNGVDTRNATTFSASATNGIVTSWKDQLENELRTDAFGTVQVESPAIIDGTPMDGLTRTIVRVFWPSGQSGLSQVELFLLRR
ncbi:MAG TPA: hypothetical protein DER58_12315 [Firmicutes bacterium]|nr:hypothetical protein [Bacillota bacterium]